MKLLTDNLIRPRPTRFTLNALVRLWQIRKSPQSRTKPLYTKRTQFSDKPTDCNTCYDKDLQ